MNGGWRLSGRSASQTLVVSSAAQVREAIAEADAHAAAGRYGKALAIVREVAAKDRQNHDLLLAEATLLSAWGRFRDVCSVCDQPWVEQSGHAPLFLSIGWSYLSIGMPSKAEAWMKRAAGAAPQDWKAHFSLGAALRQLNRLEDAIAAYERALALQPDSFDCRINLGVCRFQQRRFSEAEVEARRAIGLDGLRSVAWENLGLALARQERYAEAGDAFARAMQLEAEAGSDGSSFVNAANNLVDAGDVDAALALYEANLGRQPSVDAHYDYAFALLTVGRLIEGWDHYEFRWMKSPLLSLRPHFQKPQWAGQNLEGKTILLLFEQGFGDALQFIRYAHDVKALGARVLLSVPDAFGALAARFPGVDALVDARTALPPFDFYIHLLSLPRAFGTDVASIPAAVPYLETDRANCERWANRFNTTGGRLKVGLAWAGRPTHDRDRHRSIPLDALAVLGRVAGVRYVGLQKDVPPSDGQASPLGTDFVNLGPELRDFADTAAVIANMDLIVCVDTAVAHLAGAMGKPVWVMLPRPADFRWMLERDDTPWYPTMRLFRQHVPGDWSGVIDEVKTALELRLQQTGASIETKAPPRNVKLEPRQTLTRFSPGHKPGFSAVAATRAGIVQYFPDEPVAGDSIDWYGEYLQGQLDVLARIVKPGMTLIEVDAGVGMHALPLAAAIGPSGHAYIYESRSLMQKLLLRNLAANGGGIVTVMKRSLGGTGASSSDSSVETIDDLLLEQLHLLRVGEHTPALDVLAGATETLWRLRPLLFLSVTGDDALSNVAQRVADFGYRRWRLDTPLFNPENFNRREDDIFAGKRAIALIGVPEEIGFDLRLAHCTELA